MQEKVAAEVVVELLHSDPDRKQRNLALDDSLQESCVAVLTPRRHGNDRRMRRLVLPLWIEVQATSQHDAVKLAEVFIDFRVFEQRRQDQRQATSLENAIGVPDIQSGLRRGSFSGLYQV